MMKKTYTGLYIISLFDFLAGGLVILIMIMPVVSSSDNFFGNNVPIFVIILFYIFWGGFGLVCFLTGWKTLRFKSDIRIPNIFVSIFILIITYVISEFVRIREIETSSGSIITWFIRLLYFYVFWSICYILRPKLNANLKAFNQSVEGDRLGPHEFQ